MQVTKPIFIVGCGRSGTTLLFDLFKQHPVVAPTRGYPDGEDHEGWVQHGRCAMAGIGNVHSTEYGKGINGYNYCLHMTAADATEEVVRGMRAYYWNQVLEGDFTKRVVNKQPHLSNKLGYLLSIFPDAKVIQIVRDCRPVVASWIAVMAAHPTLLVYWPEEEYPCLWLFQRPECPVAQSALARHPRVFPGAGTRIWVDYWCRVNAGIPKQMACNVAQLCTVRYEDLVQQPERVLAALCRFCELPPHQFDCGQMQRSTSHRHSDLISVALAAQIEQTAAAARAYFGYCWGVPWAKRCDRLLRV